MRWACTSSSASRPSNIMNFFKSAGSISALSGADFINFDKGSKPMVFTVAQKTRTSSICELLAMVDEWISYSMDKF